MITERTTARFAKGTFSAKEDSVAVEEPLEIRIAGEPIAVTMRTPGDDPRLAVGFLFSEGLIRSREDIGAIAHCGRPADEGYGNTIELTPAPGVIVEIDRMQTSRRGTLTTAACGVCGRRSVDDLVTSCGVVPESRSLHADVVARATEALSGVQPTFAQTGGTHAAALLTSEGTVLASAEDVGRHNAVDKVIGALVLKGLIGRQSAGPVNPPERVPAILAVSGRASFEIVQKAAMANIPVVASVSAASSLAIDLAARAHIALATFVRGSAFNLYGWTGRVAEPPPPLARPDPV